MALIEKETINGSDVGRLVDEAYGRPVHEHVDVVPRFAATTVTADDDIDTIDSNGPAIVPSSYPRSAG
jgi:hypothetical protein